MGICSDQIQVVAGALNYFDNSVNPGAEVTLLPLTIRDRIQTITSIFTDACGSYTATKPEKPAPYEVINVKQLVSTNPLSPTTLYISSCDGSVVYNVTKPGTFVFTYNTAIFVQRAPLEKGKLANSTDCAGNATIQYEQASWADYCAVNTEAPACQSTVPGSYVNPAPTVSLSAAPPSTSAAPSASSSASPSATPSSSTPVSSPGAKLNLTLTLVAATLMAVASAL